ncbi:TetR/AcrR family transcriptional regulator [Nocardioides sp. YIM 152315]|uniref:TetR/AcrR family transcriptional regulator n=1 Tax=Nocardioides sp. YIM 152315 TaxID=3031760 RepID=UPI0023DBB886|nr:TetR/AcrR family transcriptional regulator [Nocardioides sp. YIM 152315]MDF1606319.1 TetR/AcrR family transcriptional regulator [Nocardioides sp. YIM 152315]
MARRYEMSGRTAAMRRTREAILDAAVELFGPAWFDEVTLADVATAAGVSQQTVVNHFGSKIGLYLAGVSERFVPEVTALRGQTVPGDVDSIVATVLEDYEQSGDGTYRILVLAERVAELRQLVEGGGRAHRAWVEHVFAPQLEGLRGRRRERTVVLLAATLDVSMWKRLRRDEALSADETAAHLRALVDGVLATVAT